MRQAAPAQPSLTNKPRQSPNPAPATDRAWPPCSSPTCTWTPARPHITALFERYLASAEVRHADALYILGDLVEAWIGDDDDAELPQRIASATRAVRDAGVPVYFMVGNRDFLLGEASPHAPASPCWTTAPCTPSPASQRC